MSILVATSVLVFVAIVFVRAKGGRRGSGGRPRRRGPGAGAAGAVYDLLNEDRRRALELIVEERAEATDPEHKDGNLPELEHRRSSATTPSAAECRRRDR